MVKGKNCAKPTPPLKGDKEPRTTLVPGMKIPKDIEKLALEMKSAELARKEQGAIEKDRRTDLCVLMKQKKCKAFQLEIDGRDFEFNLEEMVRVTSKRLSEDE